MCGSPKYVHLVLNSLPTGTFFMIFCRLLIFFSKSTFLKNSFRNTIRVSNSLNLGLGPNCLQRLSADDTSRPRVNVLKDSAGQPD